ncbi:MAG: protein kinase domain-containing protein [Roseiflexaceae bacterium]
MGDLAGQNLGPYRVLEQIGAGGMATVYKAYHAAMDRYVAIKVLPQHLARDPNFRARFQRESRTIARLEHRYILPVYDVGEADDIPYFVMRYTDGGDLNDLIGGKTLAITRAATIVSQVAEALAYAHRQGIIHRDIKPANILIGNDGDPLLTDFGIAKIYEDTLQLTGEGQMVGTPTYMAPEQLQGQPVDARTDIYALGVVLYQAVTGEPPFIAETPLAVMLMHIHNPLRSPRQLNSAIPESIERVILRAMAKDPKDRFQTASEMAEALREALSSLSRPTTVLPAVPTPEPLLSAVPTPEPLPSAVPTPEPAPLLPSAASRRRRSIWLGGWVAAVAAVAVAALLGRSALFSNSGGQSAAAPPTGITAAGAPPTGVTATGAPAPQATAGPIGPAATPRANLSVFSNSAALNGLAALGDNVWAATDGGLLRYGADGKGKLFTMADGLPFNWTSTVAAAPDGTLWAGAYSKVVHIRPAGDGLGELATYDDPDSLNVGQIFTFLIDNDGSVWLGADSGLRRFDGSRWQTPNLPNDPAIGELRGALALLRSQDGSLWVGLSEGLVRWDGQHWTRFGEEQGVAKVAIHHLLQSRDGTIWAAGDKGLLRFDAGKGTWQQVVVVRADEQALSIVQLANGELMASGADGTASSADGGASWTLVKMPESYSGWAGPGAIVQDSAGKIWVGAGAGAICCAAGQWREMEVPAALPSVSIGRLTPAPDGKLWAITQYGGMAATIDPATMQVEQFTGLGDAKLYAVAFTKDTQWFGTDAGLVRQRGSATLRLTTADGLPSDEVYGLLATDTTLWIGTAKGLAFYDLAANKVAGTVSELDGGIIPVLLSTPNGEIWAGSLKINDAGMAALGRYDGKQWHVWRAGDDPLSEDSSGVLALSADSQGWIWASIWNGGIHSWDGTSWRSWTAPDGAPQSNIQALAPIGDAIWLGGMVDELDGQLFRWNKDGWSHVGLGGLVLSINDMRFTSDGALWVATNDGVLRLSKEGVAALR